MALLVLVHAFRRLRRIEFVFVLLLAFVALPFYSAYAIPAFSGWVLPLLLLAAIAAMAAIPVLSFVVRSRFFKKNKTPDASPAEAPAVAVDG
jgi:putative flippase GtrA